MKKLQERKGFKYYKLTTAQSNYILNLITTNSKPSRDDIYKVFNLMKYKSSTSLNYIKNAVTFYCEDYIVDNKLSDEQAIKVTNILGIVRDTITLRMLLY